MAENLIDSIHFEKANHQHQEIIFAWLDEPHLQEFWDNSQEHKDDIINFINGRKKPSNYFNGIFTYWIGSINSQAFAFIMTSEVKLDDDIPSLWKDHISATGTTYGLDFGIGNIEFLGKGLATKTLKAFINFFSTRIDLTANTFFIDPDENNPRAKHVYEKAGFTSIGEFTMKEGFFKDQPAHLMVMKPLKNW